MASLILPTQSKILRIKFFVIESKNIKQSLYLSDSTRAKLANHSAIQRYRLCSHFAFISSYLALLSILFLVLICFRLILNEFLWTDGQIEYPLIHVFMLESESFSLTMST